MQNPAIHSSHNGSTPKDGISSPDRLALMEAPDAPAPGRSLTREISPVGVQVNRQSPAYVRWVQSSLNRIMRLNLVVDGRAGGQTRSAIRSFQAKSGLGQDGRVGPRTEAALIQAGAVPPPGAAERPSPTPLRQPTPPGVARLVRSDPQPPSTTLYLEIPLNIPGVQPLTGVFIPQGYTPGPAVDLVLYLHGFKGSHPDQVIHQYWDRNLNPHFALREKLNQSGRNVILVAPTLGPRSQAGSLTRPGGLDAFITQVLTALGRHGPFGGRTPRLGSLVLACHSGGGAPMRALATGSDRAAALIRECWGFDCTYNRGDDAAWARWGREHPSSKLFIYYLPGTATQPLALSLQRQAPSNVLVQPSAAKSHNWVPITHWRERLENAPFQATSSPRFQEEEIRFPDNQEMEGEINPHSREYIRWVQQSLNRVNQAGLVVDGVSGPRTRQAVRNFQSRRGLSADGIVGPVTERALIAAGASPAPNHHPGPAPAPAPAPAPIPASSGPVIFGLDTASVAGNQNPDWAQARDQASIRFAIIRSNYGTYADKTFRRDWPKIQQAGLVRGAYLFLRFPHPRNHLAPQDPVAQAQAMIRAMGPLQAPDLPPTLDVEFPGGRAITGLTARQALDNVRAAWQVLKDHYGVAPILYASRHVWRDDLGNLPAPDLAESPLWLAGYPFKKGPYRMDAADFANGRYNPPVPPPWGDSTNWWIHQYQGDATHLPGFPTGNVDLNRFHTLQKGAAGDQVKWAQRRLGIPQTGQFDDIMERILSAFQRSKSLPPNGIVDPWTFAHLCWSNP